MNDDISTEKKILNNLNIIPKMNILSNSSSLDSYPQQNEKLFTTLTCINCHVAACYSTRKLIRKLKSMKINKLNILYVTWFYLFVAENFTHPFLSKIKAVSRQLTY